ncbi:MAG: hypothetical protein AAGC85_18095 [Bacteroidota bacterium]
MSLKRLHHYSGLLLTAFIGLHLLNHASSIAGVETHIRIMNNLRLIYRNLFAEILLILVVGVQILSGLRLFNSKRKSVSTPFEKIHIWTGVYLAVFLLIHVSAVMGGRFLFGLDTNIYFGAVGLNTFPFNLFFIPYYALAILAFFGHIAAIHADKMEQDVLGIPPLNQANMILGLGLVFLFLIFYGLTDGFSGLAIPEAYDVMVGK